MRAPFAFLLAAALVVVLLPGFTQSEEPAPAATLHVHIEGFVFDPSTPTINPGDSVEWHNHDASTHSSVANGGSWSTVFLGQGQSATTTHGTEGSFGFHCGVHASMTGTLTVGTPPPPNVPPTVSITLPAAGATVEGIVSIAGTAADSDGTVQKVEVRFDGLGAWQPASGTTSWTLDWNTIPTSNGQHTINARSYDGVSFSTIANRVVTVANPGTVDLVITPSDIIVTQGAISSSVKVTVRNSGNSASAPFQLLVAYAYQGKENVVYNATIPALGAGFSTFRIFGWDTLGKVGDFDLYAVADRPNVVVETNDQSVGTNNNEAHKTVSFLVSGVEGIDPLDPL